MSVVLLTLGRKLIEIIPGKHEKLMLSKKHNVIKILDFNLILKLIIKLKFN